MSDAQPAALKHSPWLMLTALCMGFFMILLDTTIVNIAVPDMMDRLDASLDEILWVINAYILVYAVLLITAGRLGDLYGAKRLFLTGLVIFTVASVACGFAGTPDQLVTARVAQGVGGALLTPQTLALITSVFPVAKRGAAFGVWGSVAGLATIAGPTLGGLLVTHWGWRWIFFVNVPVGIAALLLAAVALPGMRRRRRHRLDLAGTVLVTVGLFLVTFGLIEGQPHDWGRVLGPVTIPMVIATGAAVIAAFLLHQYVHRHAEPLVPFPLFRDRNFALMNVVTAAFGFGMLGLFLPLIIYLQTTLALDALDAGLTLAPMSLVSIFVAPVAGRLADRYGGRYVLLIGAVLLALGTGIVLATATADAHRWSLLPGLLIAGLALGMTFPPLQTIAMSGIAPGSVGAASGVINTNRQLGAVVGSAAVGALLQSRLATALPAAARDNATALPEPAREPFVASFEAAGSGPLDLGGGGAGGGGGPGAGGAAGAGEWGFHAPAGLTDQLRDTFAAVAAETVREGFADAMRASLVLPIAAIAIAALTCLLIRDRDRDPDGEAPEPTEPRDEPAEPADGRDPAEPADGREPAEPADGREPAEPADAREPAERPPRDQGSTARLRSTSNAARSGDGPVR